MNNCDIQKLHYLSRWADKLYLCPLAKPFIYLRDVLLQRLQSFKRDRICLDDGKSHSNTWFWTLPGAKMTTQSTRNKDEQDK